MPTEKDNGKIFLTAMHHSDLTWQFSYEEYDKIREQQLNIVLDFFENQEGFTYILDQGYILENYLNRNPDKLAVLKKYIANGKGNLELAGSYTIPDLNLCSGESLIRNSLLALAYYQDEFGAVPKTASLMDAFGLPMQVPQVLAKLGYTHLIPGRMPNAKSAKDLGDTFVWEGMAGTGVIVVQNQAGVDKSSYLTNVPVMLEDAERFAQTLENLQNTTGNILAYYMTEIEMLDEKIFDHIAKANHRPGAKRQVTFGRFTDYCKTIPEEGLPRYLGEFNPVFTGCYTTRIRVKQHIRKVENLIFAAELALALKGIDANLDPAWKQLTLAQFHDGACGCHHDVCNVDVHHKLQKAEEIIHFALDTAKGNNFSGTGFSVLNPAFVTATQLVETTQDKLPEGVAVQKDGDVYCFTADIPPLSLLEFKTDSKKTASSVSFPSPEKYRGETDCFHFDFSSPYPVIRSKRFEHSVFGQEKFGEVLFRHESGSMWTECLHEPPLGQEHQIEKVIAVEEGPVFTKVTTKGAVVAGRKPKSGNSGDYWPGFGALSFIKEYIFPQSLPYFKLRLTLHFEGCNTKISLRVPVALSPEKSTALYDTPFAAQPRKPYFEVPYQYKFTHSPLAVQGDYTNAKGDYPALHWVDYSDDSIGLAVANSGTPGHQLVGKNIFISLLRSGTRCLDGTMVPQPGSYDNGTHTFEFAFSDHTPDQAETANFIGEIMNRKPVVLASGCAENIFTVFDKTLRVSSVYASQGKTIVRLYESFGRPVVSTIQWKQGVSCYHATMAGEVISKLESRKLEFSPYEIKTFVFLEE